MSLEGLGFRLQGVAPWHPWQHDATRPEPWSAKGLQVGAALNDHRLALGKHQG